MTLLRTHMVLAASLLLALVGMGLLERSDPFAVFVAVAAVLLSVAVVRLCSWMTVVSAGSRARAHREPLNEIAAPRHPSTPGRPMARAPGDVCAM